jgi:hypothetical protein
VSVSPVVSRPNYLGLVPGYKSDNICKYIYMYMYRHRARIGAEYARTVGWARFIGSFRLPSRDHKKLVSTPQEMFP